MNDLPKAVADACDLLRGDLIAHLDEVEFLALKNGGWNQEDITSVRKLIPDLTTVIRGVLLVHKSAPDGNCTGCLGLLAPWPCQNITTIRSLLEDPDNEFVNLMDKMRTTETHVRAGRTPAGHGRRRAG